MSGTFSAPEAKIYAAASQTPIIKILEDLLNRLEALNGPVDDVTKKTLCNFFVAGVSTMRDINWCLSSLPEKQALAVLQKVDVELVSFAQAMQEELNLQPKPTIIRPH